MLNECKKLTAENMNYTTWGARYMIFWKTVCQQVSMFSINMCIFSSLTKYISAILLHLDFSINLTFKSLTYYWNLYKFTYITSVSWGVVLIWNLVVETEIIIFITHFLNIYFTILNWVYVFEFVWLCTYRHLPPQRPDSLDTL